MRTVNLEVLKYIIVFCLCLSGCAMYKLGKLEPEFENHFSGLQVEPSKVKASPIKRSYQASYYQVWDSVLTILTQYAIIAKVSSDSGICSYVDIDGVYGIFQKNKYEYLAFPFTILIERKHDEEGCVVYVYPMEEFFIGEVGEEKIRLLKIAFAQKGVEFLERLTVQLNAQKRWPWLTTDTGSPSFRTNKGLNEPFLN